MGLRRIKHGLHHRVPFDVINTMLKLITKFASQPLLIINPAAKDEADL